MQKINSEFGINVAELPFAYELNESLFTEIEQTAQEVNKICFLGNPDKIRIKVLQNIVDNGFEVHIYGNGWNETTLALHKNVSLNPAVYKAQMWRVLRKYRVQLNIFRLHNQGSHNMRSFEVPAIGGILLTQYSDEQADFFAINKEIFTYSDNTELLSQLKYLLGLTQSQALAIRNAARQRSLTGGYSYMHRALQVLDLMKTLLN
jgi:spore maturation protein CgeB